MNYSHETVQEGTEPSVKKGFLQHLYRLGAITVSTRDKLLKSSSPHGLYIQDLLELLDLGEQEIYEHLADYCKLPLVDLQTIFLSNELLKLLPPYDVKKLLTIPIFQDGEELTIASAIPLEANALNHIKDMVQRPNLIQVLALYSQLQEVIQQYFVDSEVLPNIHKTIKHIEDILLQGKGVGADLAMIKLPIIPLVNSILESSLSQNASDIHFEPRENQITIRLRIDGRLQEFYELPSVIHDQVIARLKILSRLDLTERYVPQDGRIEIHYHGRTIEFRVSFLRTVLGEKAVLRILDRESIRVELSALGFEAKELEKVRTMSRQPNGIILVTGATGSGKSTTLYAILNEINRSDVNITTVEDPSEYRLDGVNQCSVERERGLEFPNALRAILRQDPDIIMIGEIRDLETAEIAFHAALTGHLVLATLHTNDSIGAITRLRDLGIDRSVLALGLLGIIAQNLVRKVCADCKEIYEPDESMRTVFGLPALPGLELVRGKGCEACHGKGYKGRIGIYEVLEIGTEIRNLIALNAAHLEIKQLAKNQGWHPLKFSAIRKLLQRQTTVEEVVRITG